MHVIRLRSAWEPATNNEAGGPVRFERSLGKPTNIDGGERVFLVIEPAPAGQVLLNGDPLPNQAADSSAAFRHDVSSRLNLRNLLSIDANSPTFDLNVRLEIVE